jgi:hypothetical protein
MAGRQCALIFCAPGDSMPPSGVAGAVEIFGVGRGITPAVQGSGDLRMSNSEPGLTTRLFGRVPCKSVVLIWRVPVLDRLFSCFRLSARGFLGASYNVSAPAGMGGASGAIENRSRYTSSRGRTVESERVSPAPLRCPESLSSLDNEKPLANKARARVVPESAEDAGVSKNERLEVSIVIESRGFFRCPWSVRERSLGIDSGLGEGLLES